MCIRTGVLLVTVYKSYLLHIIVGVFSTDNILAVLNSA